MPGAGQGRAGGRPGRGGRAALTVPSMLRSRRGRLRAGRLRGAAESGQGPSVKCGSPAAPGQRVPRRERPAPAALLRREGGAAAAPAPLAAPRGRRGAELLPGTGGCGAHTLPAPRAAPALPPRQSSREGRTGFGSAAATVPSPAAPASAATATPFSPHQRPAPPPEPPYYRSPPAPPPPPRTHPRTHRRPLPPSPPQPRCSSSAPDPPPQPPRAPQRRPPSPLRITPPGRRARRRAPAQPGANAARAARTWLGTSTARSQQGRERFRPVPSGARTDGDGAGVHREAMRIPVAMGTVLTG
ncbi:vegetative cell wall protein gp1-like [Corvus kubaryi]|uniref:vegetative cell wall protein gp1-like n=1 Tax=Corvus kubaryi TaxID=68294 RepID=UPI001C03A994|nr:vegetative cell wall protein gp1-like [Corvus kubaryi]